MNDNQINKTIDKNIGKTIAKREAPRFKTIAKREAPRFKTIAKREAPRFKTIAKREAPRFMTRPRAAVGVLLGLALGSLCHCGGLPNPVVLLTLKEIPGPTANIAIEVTSAKEPDTGTVTFTRDGNNDYVSGGSTSMPNMTSLSPDTVQLALDLPASLTGAVQIKALVNEPVAGTMGIFQVVDVACTSATITGKDLYTLPSLTVAAPTLTCTKL